MRQARLHGRPMQDTAMRELDDPDFGDALLLRREITELAID